VTALAFQHGTHTLYSGACDRTVKLWNMTEQAYLDTVYGHQAPVHSIDALSRERCLTSGADRSVRLWKIVEDSQLVFNGHAGNIDCVSMLNEESFLSGGEDGEVCLWSTTKKKPVASAAHALEPIAVGAHQCRDWVSAVACCRYSDLACSGAADGTVRLWRADNALTAVGTVPMDGHVNGLALSADGAVLVAGTGQEHRLGRWSRVAGASRAAVAVLAPPARAIPNHTSLAGAKNAVHVVRIGSGEVDESEEEEDDDSDDYADDSLSEVT